MILTWLFNHVLTLVNQRAPYACPNFWAGFLIKNTFFRMSAGTSFMVASTLGTFVVGESGVDSRRETDEIGWCAVCLTARERLRMLGRIKNTLEYGVVIAREYRVERNFMMAT